MQRTKGLEAPELGSTITSALLGSAAAVLPTVLLIFLGGFSSADNKRPGAFSFFRVSPKTAVSWLVSPLSPSPPSKTRTSKFNLLSTDEAGEFPLWKGIPLRTCPLLCSGSIRAFLSSSCDLPYVSFLPFPSGTWVLSPCYVLVELPKLTTWLSVFYVGTHLRGLGMMVPGLPAARQHRAKGSRAAKVGYNL